MLWQHDMHEPIGSWKVITEAATGLYVEGEIVCTVRRGAEAIDLIEAEAVGSLSIGYRSLEDEVDAKTGVRRLIKLQLFEISIVSIAMNSRARITSRKEYSAADLQQATLGFTRAVDGFSELSRAAARAIEEFRQ